MLSTMTIGNGADEVIQTGMCDAESLQYEKTNELWPNGDDGGGGDKGEGKVLNREVFDRKTRCSGQIDGCDKRCLDMLQVLLMRAQPHPLKCRGMEMNEVEEAVPALDVAFPIMHTYNLQLSDTIPIDVKEADDGCEEPCDLLRPSVRLLCRIGRSLVSEQYLRQIGDRMRLRGVNAVKVTEEARREEREYLCQTLPPAGVAVAGLRWRAKDLGEVYAQTCVKAGCCFQPDSFLALCRHLDAGHYRLRRLRQVCDKSSYPLRSPTYYYPVNPANTKEVGQHGSYGKNCYVCGECGVCFSTVRTIQAHYSTMHPGKRFSSSETCILVPCSFCDGFTERGSLHLPVCLVEMRGWSTGEVVWNELRQSLQGDAARAMSVHVLASLLLFPNAQSPLCFSTAVARGIWERSEGNAEGMKQRLMGGISAVRGVLRFTGKNRYIRVIEEGADLPGPIAAVYQIGHNRSHKDSALGNTASASKRALVCIQSPAKRLRLDLASGSPSQSGVFPRSVVRINGSPSSTVDLEGSLHPTGLPTSNVSQLFLKVTSSHDCLTDEVLGQTSERLHTRCNYGSASGTTIADSAMKEVTSMSIVTESSLTLPSLQGGFSQVDVNFVGTSRASNQALFAKVGSLYTTTNPIASMAFSSPFSSSSSTTSSLHGVPNPGGALPAVMSAWVSGQGLQSNGVGLSISRSERRPLSESRAPNQALSEFHEPSFFLPCNIDQSFTVRRSGTLVQSIAPHEYNVPVVNRTYDSPYIRRLLNDNPIPIVCESNIACTQRPQEVLNPDHNTVIDLTGSDELWEVPQPSVLPGVQMLCEAYSAVTSTLLQSRLNGALPATHNARSNILQSLNCHDDATSAVLHKSIPWNYATGVAKVPQHATLHMPQLSRSLANTILYFPKTADHNSSTKVNSSNAIAKDASSQMSISCDIVNSACARLNVATPTCLSALPSESVGTISSCRRETHKSFVSASPSSVLGSAASVKTSSARPPRSSVPSFAMVQGRPFTACASLQTETIGQTTFASMPMLTPVATSTSASMPAFVHRAGWSGGLVASDAMMCPMCTFSSCDGETIMQHVIDAH